MKPTETPFDELDVQDFDAALRKVLNPEDYETIKEVFKKITTLCFRKTIHNTLKI